MRILIVLLLYSLVVSCQAQSQNTALVNAPKNFEQDRNADYFVGTWKLTAKNYAAGNEKKVFPLHECMRQYTCCLKKTERICF
ncbi:DUF6705 family protein [Chryseobacterium tongliaoense]|uniref:DUF6705 family protein n=1 Tax=Chryseobacterium tongliaoense TaxID=3240933 RepID=UPI0035145FFB